MKLRKAKPSLAPILLVLSVGLFLAHGWVMFTAPFGDSHDGRNAATWAEGSRSLREHGPIISRFGALAPERDAYANHPPLLLLEASITETIGGASRLSTRAPAWIGSVAALLLLFILLKDQHFDARIAALAVVFVATSPMFLTFGGMLDTPITAFPFALGLLILWFRAISERTVSCWAFAILSFLSVLASWQGLILAVMVGVWGAAGLIRGRHQPQQRRAAIAGLLLGLFVLVGWIAWAYSGSLRPLIHQFLFRTETQAVDQRGGLIAQQWLVQTTMFGKLRLLLVAFGLVSAVRTIRVRPLLAAVLAVTVPYFVFFPNGIRYHEYWNYWFLIPVALAIACGAEQLLESSEHPAKMPIVIGVCLLILLSATSSFLLHPPPPYRRIHDGMAAGRLVNSTVWRSEQTVAWYAGYLGHPPSWLQYKTRLPVERVTNMQVMEKAHPNDLIFVGRVVCSTQVYTVETAREIRNGPPPSYCNR